MSYGNDIGGLSTLAHELGHALNDKHLLGKIVHSPFSGIGLRAAPLTGFGIGFTDEETISTPKAMALAAAPALPTLAAEAGASIRADRLMRQHGVSPAALSRGRKNLLRAFGTYTLAPAAAALNVADYGYVLENGRIVMEDTCERLREKEDIKEFYLGMKEAGARGERRWKKKKTSPCMSCSKWQSTQCIPRSAWMSIMWTVLPGLTPG